MELRQLATFVAVAEEGSFTRASERLHVVQSAVSAGVRNLEKELGARLFDRSTHKVELTDAGLALLPEARATLASAVAAHEAVDQVRGGLRGTVVLGTMQAQTWHSVNVPGLVAAFRAAHPAVAVKIRQGSSSEMAREVRDGQVDLAFLALPERSIPGVELTAVAREPIVLAVAAGHPLAARSSIALAVVSEQAELVEPPPGYGIRIATDRAFAAAGVTRNVTYEIYDAGSIVEWIRHGIAVGLLPISIVEAAADLVSVPISDHPPEFKTVLAVPSNRRLSAANRAMQDTIKRYLGL